MHTNYSVARLFNTHCKPLVERPSKTGFVDNTFHVYSIY